MKKSKPVLPDSARSKELSAGEFTFILWSRKWLIGLFVLAGIFVSLLLKPFFLEIYRADVVLSSPGPVILENFFLPEKPGASVSEVFGMGLLELESPELQIRVFEMHMSGYGIEDQADHTDVSRVFTKVFQPSVRLKFFWPDKSRVLTETKSVRLSMEHRDPELTVAILRDLVAGANEAVMRILEAERERLLAAELTKLNHTLSQAKLMQRDTPSDFLADTVSRIRLEINVLKSYPQPSGEKPQALNFDEITAMSAAPVRSITVVALGLGSIIGFLLGAIVAVYSHAHTSSFSRGA